MKPVIAYLSGALALSMAVATSAAAQPVTHENYLDAPQTPGDWSYGSEASETLAMFGDSSPDHLVVMRCDRQTRVVGIARRSDATRPLMMRIRTETTDRILTANPVAGRTLVSAFLPASDPLLDAMAISKGRIAIEVEGMPALYIPSWVEITRVIEDCR